MKSFEIQNITFGYTDIPLIENLSATVHKGGVLAITGASGSGKTTLLRLMNGEFDLFSGQIKWGSELILGPKFKLVTGPEFMKYVAQEFELLPYVTVSESVGKFLSNFYPAEKTDRVNELLSVVQLSEYGATKVQYLSGGQKQRVALAQAMAKEPEILLLDEPFSHIDNFRKNDLRRRLFKYLEKKEITCVIASHDKDDVLPYADHMIVLDAGRILIQGDPRSLYKDPGSSLTAAFFGEFNLFTNEEIGSSDTDLQDHIVYAHQLTVVDHSKIQVTVRKNYYMGERFLITAEFNGRSIFFYHGESIRGNSKVYLKIFR